MTGRRGRGAILLLAAGVFAVCWLLTAPQQLGGSTIYASTVGNSMEPLFHGGDLALVRPAAGYRVHDIVLYESPILHRPVLHRIIAIHNGRYYFKGDQNDFVDPGYATRSDLLGTLWLRVPMVGNAVTFLGQPTHAGALGAAVVLLLVLGGGPRRRKRRKHMTKALLHIHKPRHPIEDVGTLGLIAAAALALVVGFTTPTTKAVSIAAAYSQSGAFTYSAPVLNPKSRLTIGTATTGQPIFFSESKTFTVLFRYHFASRYAHSVRGTVGLDAELTSQGSSWHRRYVVVAARPFTGDEATIRTTLPLAPLAQIIGTVAIASGSPADSYVATLIPTVRVHGYIDGKPLSERFDPMLPFTVTRAVIKLDINAAGPVAGATSAPASPQALLQAALNPTAPGAIPGRGPRTVSLARTELSVVDLRGIGIGFAGLLALVILTRPMRGRRQAMSVEQRIASNAGSVIVDVVAFPLEGARVAVPDFASLVGLARYLERPILRDLQTGAFTLADNGQVYAYLPGRATPEERPAPPRAKRAGKPRLLRWIAPGLAIAVAGGAAVSFTATNVVPLSNAGVSAQALTLSQLAPSQCGGLNLSHLIVAAGSSTVGPSGGDLILGRPGTGNVTLKGGAGDDCIVAGGGPGTRNTLDGGGGTGDVCIGAPGAQNIFKNCAITY